MSERNEPMDRKIRRRFIMLHDAINTTGDLWEIARTCEDPAGLDVDALNRAHDILFAQRAAMQRHLGLTDQQVREAIGLEGAL